jgi:microsomal dipeptidase-like Zn-dependent dipeptidase
MAFRKKADFILTYNPDILIVPECENHDKLLFSINTPKPTDVLWFGKNNNKGLAIFSYSNFRLTLLENHNQDLQMIVPVAETDGQIDFNLFAILSNNPTDRDGQYIEQVWKAVHHYNALLKDTKTILVGDFNSNTIWDKKHREGNHTNLVKLLEDRGIFQYISFIS